MGKSFLRPILRSAIIFFAATVIPPVSFAGSVQAPYEIGTWEGFRPAAISYTFDDNLPNQYAIAVPMFHTAGFKMTLFTVINYWTSFTWSQAQTAASYGDEIASHTVTHPNLATNTPTQLTNELANSQSIINSHITNESCVTLAYPNCAVPNETVVAQYYIAARGCSGQLVSSTPSDFLNISSFVLGNTGSYTTGASINSLANNAAAAKAWCVYLIHELDSGSGYSPLPSTALQASVDYMRTNQDKFWVETFGNVARYIKERNASSVAETTSSGNSITIQVTNNLNILIYNFPITLRRPVPANWPAVAVSQNNQPITAKFVTVNSTNYVMFDVVPNGGDVTLSKTVLPFTLSNPVLTAPASLSFRLNGQTGVTYTVYSSTDLLSWLPVQSNLLVDPYTDLTVDASKAFQAYRAQWTP
jgi:oligosaccharide reducing-end xylanase